MDMLQNSTSADDSETVTRGVRSFLMGYRFATIAVVCLLASSASAQSDAPMPLPAAPESPSIEAPNAPRVEAPQPPTIETPNAPPVEAPQPPLPETPTSTVPGTVPPPVASATPSEQSNLDSALDSELASAPFLSKFQIHGFVSEGGFISTTNEYIGESARGSLKLFEAGINVSLELTDQLRVGLQLVSRSVGTLSEEVPRLDWAVIDYRWRPWLGLRAGLIKMPLGLYNEYVDIDSARTAILLPQSLYPVRNRDALISHMGFAAHGHLPIGLAGELDYQAWLGTLTIPRSALVLSSGATLDSVDTRYVTGGQLFWHPPLSGLRVGATYMRAVIDFNISLASGTVSQVVMAGIAPANFDGKLVVSQDPTSFWVGSAEYMLGDWLFAAEYSRWLKHQHSSLPQLSPDLNEDSERMYAMASYRLSGDFEIGAYYSIVHADVHDRLGRNPRFKHDFQAFQRDLATTLRLDINEYWLWKLEAHFIDGTAELQAATNPNPKRYWGLFLLRTTVTF